MFRLVLLPIVALGACSTPHPSARVDAYVAPLVASGDFAGTVLVRDASGDVHTRAYGVANLSSRAPNRADTRYSAASITKGITAATLVTLQREGRLDFADPIALHLPALAGQKFTIEQVMRHRAGLPRDLDASFRSGGQSMSEWLATHADQLGPVGEEAYSNVGYVLLAELIERTTAEPFADAATRRVLIPLGMTGSRILDGEADLVPGGAEGLSPGPSPVMLAASIPFGNEPGAVGLVAPAADLERWVRSLADGRWPELFVGDDPLGSIDEGDDALGHYVSVQGSLPGYFAQAIAWRDSPRAIVAAGNVFSYPVLSLGRTLRGLAAGPLDSPAARPADVPLDARHRALAGRYKHPDFGLVELAQPDEGDFFLTLPERGPEWRFYLTPLADGSLHWRAFDQRVAATVDGLAMSPGVMTGGGEPVPLVRRD